MTTFGQDQTQRALQTRLSIPKDTNQAEVATPENNAPKIPVLSKGISNTTIINDYDIIESSAPNRETSTDTEISGASSEIVDITFKVIVY